MGASSRIIIQKLEENGWYLDRIKGSHYQFKHNTNPKIVTVPHPKKELPNGTRKQIEKISGLTF